MGQKNTLPGLHERDSPRVSSFEPATFEFGCGSSIVAFQLARVGENKRIDGTKQRSNDRGGSFVVGGFSIKRLDAGVVSNGADYSERQRARQGDHLGAFEPPKDVSRLESRADRPAARVLRTPRRADACLRHGADRGDRLGP